MEIDERFLLVLNSRSQEAWYAHYPDHKWCKLGFAPKSPEAVWKIACILQEELRSLDVKTNNSSIEELMKNIKKKVKDNEL